MSISSMTNVAMSRRPDFGPKKGPPVSFTEVAAAAKAPPAAGAPPPTTGGGGTNISDALQVITTYVPTEVLTLYVALLAATHPSWTLFWVFVVATPLVVWTVFAGKLRNAGQSLPVAPASWPMWEMVAATIAYVVWAFTLPNSPFTGYAWYSSGVAAVAVLVASTVLGLLTPVVARPLKK